MYSDTTTGAKGRVKGGVRGRAGDGAGETDEFLDMLNMLLTP